MKITKRQLKRLVREESDRVHARNMHDDFPVLVRYSGRSEIAYSNEEVDEILRDIAGRDIPYSIDSLADIEPESVPAGSRIETFSEGTTTRITKRQLRRIIKEEMSLTGEVVAGDLDKHFDALVAEVKRKKPRVQPYTIGRIISEAFNNYAWRKLR